MKNTLLLLLVFALSISACREDDDISGTELRYDGDNQSAPFFPAGEHEVAVRFPTSTTTSFEGQRLTEIRFYLVNLPSECQVRVYGPGSPSEPGDLRYQFDLSGNVQANSWNVHALTEDLSVGAEDLWISVRLVHPVETNTIGCDAGPARQDGEWILSTANNGWETFRDRTSGQVSINWNLRGVVE
ncbi:MAG: hypothetical protein AAFW73_05250 [Bacteroidota bacterium]